MLDIFFLGFAQPPHQKSNGPPLTLHFLWSARNFFCVHNNLAPRLYKQGIFHFKFLHRRIDTISSKGVVKLINFLVILQGSAITVKPVARRVLYRAIFLETCLVFDDHMRLKEPFHWVMLQTVATQVSGQLLHCAMSEKMVATLREAFNLSHNVLGRCKLCYIKKCFVQLVAPWRCAKSCIVVTAL